MKIEHIRYLEGKLEEKNMDDDLLQTYSAKSWRAFIIRHMNNTRRLLKVGLGEELQFPLDLEVEEYFIKIFRRLVKTGILGKNDVPERAILKYLDEVINERNRKYCTLIWSIFELCFISVVDIPENILRTALYYDNIRIKVFKMLVSKIDPQEMKMLVEYYAPDIERALNSGVIKNLSESTTPQSFPVNLVPPYMTN